MRRPIVLLSLVLLFVPALALAADPVKLVGTVSITEDEDWNITAVTLTTPDNTAYKVVLDENGKKLGSEAEGDKVELTATVADKDGLKWITVSDFKVIPEQ